MNPNTSALTRSDVVSSPTEEYLSDPRVESDPVDLKPISNLWHRHNAHRCQKTTRSKFCPINNRIIVATLVVFLVLCPILLQLCLSNSGDIGLQETSDEPSTDRKTSISSNYDELADSIELVVQFYQLFNPEDRSTFFLERIDHNIHIHRSEPGRRGGKEAEFYIHNPILTSQRLSLSVRVEYLCPDWSELSPLDPDVSDVNDLDLGTHRASFAEPTPRSEAAMTKISCPSARDSFQEVSLTRPSEVTKAGGVVEWSLRYTQSYPALIFTNSSTSKRATSINEECTIGAISRRLVYEHDSGPSREQRSQVFIAVRWATELFEIYTKSQPPLCDSPHDFNEYAIEHLCLLVGLELFRHSMKLDDFEEHKSPPSDTYTYHDSRENIFETVDRWLPGENTNNAILYVRWVSYGCFCLALLSLHRGHRDLSSPMFSVGVKTACIWYRPFRPRLRPGMTRVEWTCSCGERMYGDFKEGAPGALRQLARQLASLSIHSDDRIAGANTVLSGSAKDANDSSMTGKSTSIVSGSEYSPQSNADPLGQATVLNRRRSSMQTGQRILEICMVGESHFHKLAQVVSGRGRKPTDRSIFEAIRAKYSNHRKSFLLSRFSLHIPKGANFIRLQTFQKDLVSVIKQEPLFPPKIEVLAGRYEYEPVPMNEPPMPSNVFLHYLNHDSEAHNTSLWSARFPYRLGDSLVGTNTKPMTMAWGVEIEEGPNMLIFSLLTIAGLLLSGAVAIVYGILKHDSQTAVAIGAWLTAIQTLVVMILFFRWAEHTA